MKNPIVRCQNPQKTRLQTLSLAIHQLEQQQVTEKTVIAI
jgi:hypothetical protein